MCLCILCANMTHEGQKRVLDPLKLELQIVVSIQVGIGNRTEVS